MPGRLVPREALGGRHAGHEVEAGHRRQLRRFLLQRRDIEHAVRRIDDDAVRHAFLADAGGQRARVDAGDADDAARLQPLVEAPRRAPIGRFGDVGLQDAAGDAGTRRRVHRLDVFLVRADIADMREGEGDDLPGIGRVGQDLLVAGHRGVEADLARRLAFGADADALNDGAVVEDEEGGRLRFAPGRRRHLRSPPAAVSPRAGRRRPCRFSGYRFS